MSVLYERVTLVDYHHSIAIALAPGKYSGKIGEIYVDSTCQYKCVFLLSNRAICVPVCPIYYGFECPIGSVIRWRMVPDSYAKQCKCRKPICVDIGEYTFVFRLRLDCSCREVGVYSKAKALYVS